MKTILKAGMISFALALLVVVTSSAQHSGGMHGTEMAPGSDQNMRLENPG